MWHYTWTESTMPVIGFNTLVQVQKLIETSMTEHIPTVITAAPSLSTPGLFHQMQFDQYGRTARVNEILVQITGAKPLLLAPYNIGSPPIFPVPTWEERQFAPQFYSELNEKAMIAINSLCILLCVLLVGVVLKYWRSPVIRAATPSFCLVIILGGVLMLISNYFNTLVVNDSHCAASVWFLTLGFTTVFAAMFVKTFRVRSFRRRTQQISHMRNHAYHGTICSYVVSPSYSLVVSSLSRVCPRSLVVSSLPHACPVPSRPVPSRPVPSTSLHFAADLEDLRWHEITGPQDEGL
jgi:hypothetical protein